MKLDLPMELAHGSARTFNSSHGSDVEGQGQNLAGFFARERALGRKLYYTTLYSIMLYSTILYYIILLYGCVIFCWNILDYTILD